MQSNVINIRGARQHNLKNIDLTLPRNRFIVITGLSGSGKSSLAFDTLYAEGQRRYVESLSTYARQIFSLIQLYDSVGHLNVGKTILFQSLKNACIIPFGIGQYR